MFFVISECKRHSGNKRSDGISARSFHHEVSDQPTRLQVARIFKPHPPLKSAYLSHGALVVVIVIVVHRAGGGAPLGPQCSILTPCLVNWPIWPPWSDMAAPIVVNATPCRTPMFNSHTPCPGQQGCPMNQHSSPFSAVPCGEYWNWWLHEPAWLLPWSNSRPCFLSRHCEITHNRHRTSFAMQT